MRAGEAAELVATLPARRRGDGRGVGPGLRETELRLLELLLRLSKSDDGTVPFQRGTKNLARNARCSPSSVERARRRLVQLGYLEVLRRGSGDLASLYRVRVERLGTVADDVNSEVSVNPGQNALPASGGRHGADPRSARCWPPVSTVLTPTRARVSSSRSSRKDPPNPPPASPAGGEISAGRTGDCPTALLRGRRCANCRRCGTTARQLAAAAAAAERLSAAEARKRSQLAARDDFETARAAAAAAAERHQAATGMTRAQAAAAAIAAARRAREELAISEHLADVASSEKPNEERKSG